ncbi:MAG: hypothetical protein A3F14_07090 [Gammaproteobacteria bacterium RIFCSPHIGHO2_12_FULL_43_28]|nr:MAG: hypothetical protein A3F14_07090 [Gammaproteobacteria bacterium RIFCSPHIGHO2_12_FULL_43_28]
MTKLSQHDIENELIAITKQLLAESGEPYKREIRLDDSLQRHLRIDSLARSELFQRIEKQFEVTIPDRLLVEAENLNDIAAFLQKTSPGIKEPLRKEVMMSHGEKVTVDFTKAKTLVDIILIYGKEAPNKPHIYFQHEDGQEEVITYGQLLQSSLRVAAGLRERGLQEGETVAIMLPSHPTFFYTFYGTLLAGGIPVPIYPPFRAHMIEAYAKTEAKILKSAEVRILVTFQQAENLSRILQAFVPSLKVVTTANELMSDKPLEAYFKPTPENFAFIQYTSGSTSDPKGVLLSHFNLISNVNAYGKATKLRSDDVAVSWLPLYHDLGLIGMWLGSLYHGIPLILMTPFTFLNHPERWFWMIHYHRGTISGAPNFAYELCLRKLEPAMLEGLDLSSWRIAANGAEKIYPRTLEQFAEKFAPFGFKRSALLPVYGLAESTVGLAIPPLDRDFWVDHVDRKLFEEERKAVSVNESDSSLSFVSCGLPIEGHAFRVVDDAGNVLPERHVGNFQFTGPSNMQGYYNNPRATEAIYHEGWLDSGDLAYIANGEVFITGRCKDLIIKAGRNLYPAEIEELVGNVEGVRQGCVTAFGVTDAERGTEKLIVVAETRETSRAKREEIIDLVNEAMSSAIDLVPDQVVLVAPRTIPKTSSGKLQRAASKTMYVEGRLGKKQVPTWLQITKLAAGWLQRKVFAFFSALGRLIYTTYAAIIFTLMFFPLWITVMFASRIFAAKACRWWANILLSFCFCPVKKTGLDKLEKASPVIYAANHASYIDAIVALTFMPVKTRFVGKKELLHTPIVRTFMKKLDYLSVDRLDLSKGLADSQYIERALKSGDAIFIFPEGTFGYAAGLRPFRLGAFKVAIEANSAVCPIALKGTRHILRAGERLLRPGRIEVTVCDPIMPAGTEWEHVTQLRNQVRAEIVKYSGEPSLDFIAAEKVAPAEMH